MNEIFGLPMTGIMYTLLVVLSLCLLLVAWVGLRRPVVFKMGMRNIPRRRAQSTLVVIGLMLSTLIIGAALGTGDTVDYSMRSEVYNIYGQIDELIVASPDVEADIAMAAGSTIDAGALAIIDQAIAGNNDVEAVMPLLETRLPVLHEASGLADPDVLVMGLDPHRIGEFGGIQSTSGVVLDLASIGAGELVVSAKLADALDLRAGDTLTLYYRNEPFTFSVAGIGENSFLTGVRREGLETIGLAMSLEQLQQMTGQQGHYSAIAISNAGGVRDGVKLSTNVTDTLKPSLEGTGLGVLKIKQAGLDETEAFANMFTGLFMVLGLFSIAAGLLLIVLIFSMLAAERRSEMGMARAVGTQRSQLIQQFISEGAGYAVLAGLVGAGLGVVATWGIAQGLQAIFGDFVNVEPHVTPRSMIVAYCLGVVITFVTVIGASWKVSRINIVAAVRDIPDVEETRRKKSGIIWAGLLLAGGTLLTVAGLNAEQAFPFFLGMSLIPFGVAMIGRFFGVPSRLLFSLAGLYLLVLWLLPESTTERLFGHLSGDMEMFFLSGIFMVVGATILIINNTGMLLAGVSSLGGLFRSKLPAVRTAVAYPGATRGRTGMMIAMFSLIIFSIIVMATMTENMVALFGGEESAAGWDVRADLRTTNPVDDFMSTLQEQGVDTAGITALSTTTYPGEFYSQVRKSNTSEWKAWPIVGMDDAFIQESTLFFERRAIGYDTDEAIIQALLTEPGVAVVDPFVIPSSGNLDSGEELSLAELGGSSNRFEPLELDLVDPATGKVSTVKVIGVLDGKLGSLWGVYTAQDTIDAAYSRVTSTSYFIALDDPDTAADVARAIETGMLRNGVQAVSIRDQIKEEQRQSAGFLYIIQGFMGLGLLVGVAAVGVISFRSVVERRQQIGVLRSLGFQRETVSQSFMIETAFVVGIGVISGTVLGLLLARNLLTGSEFNSTELEAFLIPWQVIGLVVAGTMATALLMTWIPARQATRVMPAEALRYE